VTSIGAPIARSRLALRLPQVQLTPYLLLLPAALLFGSLFGAFVILGRYSVSQGATIDVHGYTSSQYRELLSVPYERKSLTNSLQIAAWVTSLAILLAYPLALQLLRSRRRALLIALILIPVLLDVVIRSYGWVMLLGPTGVVPRVLHFVGLGSPPLLFNKTGIVIALLNELLPFMVVPIFISLASVETSVLEAAALLGASPRQTFLRILLPLSAPGLIAGAVIVFALAYSALAVPLFLGGDRVATVAILIKQQMVELLNFPLGASVAVLVGVLMVIALLSAQRLVVRLFFAHYS
jgi:putative spermidine/putrescine transport system permease protein